MNVSDSKGFTLIELAVVVLIFGLVAAFSVPSFSSFTATNTLRGSVERIRSEFRVRRQMAANTGTPQTIHFTYNYQNSDYHIHNGSTFGPSWKLPKGVTYYWGSGTVSNYSIDANGRVSPSGLLILQNVKGARDTLSIQVSGLVLTQ